MTPWQRRLRWSLGVFSIVFAVALVFAFRSRPPASTNEPVERTDPGATVESTGGRIERFKLSREDVSVEYEKQLTYADGSTRMIGVKVITAEKEGGRTFTITGNEGQIAQNESTIRLDGDVRLEASDGLVVRTEHATYVDAEGIARADGPVDFMRNRLKGNGMGMTYDKGRDALTILDQAIVHVEPDAQGAGAFDVTSGSATLARKDHVVRFDRGMHIERDAKVIDANSGAAQLTADEKQLGAIELRGSARITGKDAVPGGLQSLNGDSIDLKYLPDGATLQHALIAGASTLEIAGQPGASGRRVEADTIDISLAPDGATPTALVAHKGVRLSLPAEKGVPARTITADALDSRGDGGKGLTSARFTGNVNYREVGAGAGRAARARTLDVVMKPGMADIDDATFTGGARFEEGAMGADAASARYSIAKGTLELSGSEPARRVPRVLNEQITVDAARIDLTLAGPKMKAAGGVQSELHPSARKSQGDMKLPAMFKQDQPVNVTAEALDYDGTASKAIYTGNAQLWQGDTSVKGATVTIDDKTGDLSSSGPATTTTMLEQADKDKPKERVRSIGTADSFVYQESVRRATYTGSAHLSGPQGDMTAGKIELYLKPSGDELDRAEAYDDKNGMTLREQSRTTTGSRLTYTAADDVYVVTGIPVKIADQCGRETTGRTLTFHRATDNIVVDGNGFRTQTKGGADCR